MPKKGIVGEILVDKRKWKKMEIKTMVIERRSNVWERVRRSHILNIASAARESDDNGQAVQKPTRLWCISY